MNEQEFSSWLPNANTSALGVQQKNNDTKILSLTTPKDGVVSATDLAEAEMLSAQNEKIEAQKAVVKANQEKAATLAASASHNQNRTETLGSGMPLAPVTSNITFPRSIGTLKAFSGDREVLSSKNGRKEVLSAEERALRLGTFIFGAVAQNERTRRSYQSKAEEYGLSYLTMNEGTVGAGGYLVPPEFSNDFIYLSQQYGVFRKYARNIAVTSNDYRQPRKQSSLTAYWEGENSAITKSAMGIDQIQVLLKRLSSLTDISNELNADSIIGLTDWLVKDSVIQMSNKEDDAGFNGDGTLAYGNTVGIIPGLLAVGSATVAPLQGTGSTWAAQTKSDIEKLMGALPLFPGMKPKLYCSNAYYRNVLRALAINAGGNTVITVGQGGAEFQFDGTEVVISQVLPNTDPGSGTISLLYGDLEFASTFITKGEYTVFQANQGDTNVANNTMSIRIDERIGIINHELGSSSLAGCVVGLKSN